MAASVALVAAALVCGAAARASPNGVSSLSTLFQGLDMDQDGLFTLADAQAFYAINGVAHDVCRAWCPILCHFFARP